MKQISPRFVLLSVMILAAAATRILPHPPNFTPIAAMALFGAAHFRSKTWAFLVPLAAMFSSDLVLEITTGWGFHALLPAVYGSFIAITCIGLSLREQRSPVNVAAAALSASVLFFVVTNLATWAGGGLYPRSLTGLLTCYELAIPFFTHTLVGDLVYTGVLFGLFALAENLTVFAAPTSNNKVASSLPG